MNRRRIVLTAACLSALISAQQWVPVSAMRPPIGAVAGSNKLMQGVSADPNNLSFSPILLDLAKLIGRIGLSPGFFLQNDSIFSNEPSIDLRTLLLYQAGLIKLPLHNRQRGEAVKASDVPTLSIPSIPEKREPLTDRSAVNMRDELPNLASAPLPREMQRDQVVPPPPNVGQPGDVTMIAARVSGSHQPASTPLVSIDVPRLQEDLTAADRTAPGVTQIVADIPHLAMAMPRTNAMPFITRNMFRLWTWRTDAENAEGANGGNVEAPATTASFNGTFVVATAGAIKSITGRHFTMAPGRLLANNQGGELLFETALATVSLEPEATAVVEVTSQNNATTVKIYALESSAQNAVVVTMPGAKPTSYKLGAGEVLLLADHPVTEADLARSYIESQHKLGANMVRGKFPVNRYVEQEVMLKSQSTTAPYGVLTSLKSRIAEPQR
jgi:hypothetical protein